MHQAIHMRSLRLALPVIFVPLEKLMSHTHSAGSRAAGHLTRALHLLGLVALLAGVLLPLLPAQSIMAQEIPPAAPITDVPVTEGPVQSAAVSADGPPIRATTFTNLGNIFYPAQARFNSSTSVTIETWAYVFFAAIPCQTIVDNQFPDSYWFGVCDDGTTSEAVLRFHRGSSGSVDSTVKLKYYHWYHLAVSYDGANATFYVDGIAAGGGALAAPVLADRELRIGGLPSDSLYYGSFDELRIWSVARTQAQIRDNIFKEVRSGAGLAATFGDGGLHEDLQPVAGTPGTGIGATKDGLLPKDLTVPIAATAPVLDGNVDPNTEYAGAEIVNIRFVRSDGDWFAAGQPVRGDLSAYLLRTATDLYIGLPRVGLFCDICSATPFADENATIAILLDLPYLRPETAQPAQNRILIPMSTLDPATAIWQNGNGTGDFVNCTGPSCPARGPLWDVAKIEYDGGEFSPDQRAVEIRISESLLGSFDEVDGFALGQINTPLANLHHFAPVGALMGAPDTWATLIYGDSTASIPRVRVKGTVVNELAPGKPPLPNQKVSFGAIGQAAFQTTTDANGAYEFDVYLPEGKSTFLQVIECANCRAAPATVSGVGIQPTTKSGGVSYPGCTAALCTLADATLRAKLPPGPVTFTNPPLRPVARMITNTSTNSATSATTVVINGVNLHEDTTFFLSPMPVLQGPQFDPSEWILLPAPVVGRGADMKSVTVSLPTLPKLTKSFNTSVNQGEALNMDWRWIVMDNWFRPDWVDKRASGTFRLLQPAYPEIWGMGFDNESTSSSFAEFTSVYGDNAYLCIGAFGACVTHVIDPLYGTLFYGIYRGIISQTGGSCVGMSATSGKFAGGQLNASTFDPAANFPAGITVRPDADFDYDSTLGPVTGPAHPVNLWAHIRRNHGVQVSSSVWRMSAEQLIDSAQDGFMDLQVSRLRGGPTSAVISMKNPDAVFGGHAVTPYKVEDVTGGAHVSVYDNNYPMSKAAFIDFTYSGDTFKFWDYDDSGGTLFVYPLSTWNGDATFPADIPGMVGNVIFGDSGDPDALAATLDGSPATPQNTTQALITTSAGQYGYLPNGQFINTLPNAAPIPLFGANGEDLVFSPVLLPATDPAPIITINSDQPRYFYMSAADGNALGVRGNDSTPGDHDTVKLTYSGQDLSGYELTPQRSTTELLPQIGMNLGEQERLLFRFWGLDTEGGKPSTFTMLPADHGVTHKNGASTASEHFLIVDAVDGAAKEAGTRIFGPLDTPAGATQRITVADWPVGRSVKVETDANSDGTFETTEFFGGRSCGSEDNDDNGVPDSCQSGMNTYMPVISK